MINVQVDLNGNETSSNLLRRFTRRVQESGLLPRVRSKKDRKRSESKYVKKNKALSSIAHRKEIQKLIKLGKIQPQTKRG